MPYKHITQKEARRMKRVCETLNGIRCGNYIGPALINLPLGDYGKGVFDAAAHLQCQYIARRSGNDLKIYAATTL